MVAFDSAFFCTFFCLSTLSLVMCFDREAEGADPSINNKVQLIQSPYFPAAAEGPYKEFYENPNQMDGIWKRAPSTGFYGMRGKKAPSVNFYGMRGKKGPAGFMGMRGKKMDRKVLDNGPHLIGGWGVEGSGEERMMGEGQELDDQMAKREPAQGFMGLRGKRSALRNQNGDLLRVAQRAIH